MRKFYLFLLAAIGTIFTAYAQVVVATPEFPTVATPVTIVFDATQGSKGLMGYTGDVYAHTGVITDESKGDSDWRYASSWNANEEKYKMTFMGSNKWKLEITPDIRSYYGVPAEEVVRKMAFVFRSADRTKEGKDTGNKDIFVEVYEEGLTVRFDAPISNAVLDRGETLSVKASASLTANMKLFVDNQEIASQSGVKEIAATHTFTENGNYELKVEATANGITEKASLMVNVLGESPQAPRPGNVYPGINYTSDTEAVLVLQAPGKKNVYVVGDFNDWKLLADYQLKQDGEYFWITLSNLQKGVEYAFQYVVDGSIYIADPYADKVLDPWNDSHIPASVYPDLKPYPTGKASGIVSVLQTGQQPYAWQVDNFAKPAKDQLLIYEMLIRDFTEEHSYKAAMEKLDYLKTLGINAIELMPVNEFEGNISWGYNPSFYFAVDKYYGTKNDLKAFVDKCHKLGIAVILDLVLNHSYGQSPFYLLYRDADDRPSANNPWYNQKSNIENPGLSWGYDFNHDSPYTQALVDSVAAYWMHEYRVDGFRYDFTKGFSNTSYAGMNNWAGSYDAARIRNLKRMASEVWKRNERAYVICEHLTDMQEEKELGQANLMLWKNMNNAYCQSAMGYSSESAFTGLYEKEAGMPYGSLVGYMESHDEERTAYKAWKYGVNGIKGDLTGGNIVPTEHFLQNRMGQLAVNAAFFLTVPGAKMIWQFGELGYDYSINTNTSGTAIGDYRTDPKPVRWDYYEKQRRKELYEVYSKLIGLRKSYPELFTSDAVFAWKVTTTDWNKGRFITITAGDKALVVVGNFTGSSDNYSVTFPKSGIWYEFMDETETIDVSSSATPQTVAVPSYDFKLYTNFKPDITGLEGTTPGIQTPTAYYDAVRGELVMSEEAFLVEIYSVNGVLVQKVKNCSSVGLSALPIGGYIARIYVVNGKVGACKIVK